MYTFQETYNYLCGIESDNVITIEEFLEYYENVLIALGVLACNKSFFVPMKIINLFSTFQDFIDT